MLYVRTDHGGSLPKHLVDAWCSDIAVEDRPIGPHPITTGFADVALDHPEHNLPTWFRRTEFQTRDMLKIIEKSAVRAVTSPGMPDLDHLLVEGLEELA
jgi:hypothetical protein